MARPRERAVQGGIAQERIGILFKQAAELASAGDFDGASRRVRQARDISLRCNVRIPRGLKLRFCRKCLAYFSSESFRCRLNPKDRRLELRCLRCGHTKYLPYVREKRRV